MELEKLFVYGTLKKGHPLHSRLQELGAKYLGDATLSGYSMYQPEGTWYPAIIPDLGGAVHGEVYKIPERMLDVLDRVEGVPSLYKRLRAHVYCTEGGSRLTAWTYVYQRTVCGATKIKSGSWE